MNWTPCNLKMKENSYNGRLIVFDGIDGSGKTTYLTKTSEYLKSLGVKHILTRTPTDGIRDMHFWKIWHHGSYGVDREQLNGLGINLMAMGDRLVHQSNIVERNLAEGIWVLSDRSFFTNFVYDESEWLKSFLSFMLRPDLAVLLDITVENAMTRLESRIEEDSHPADQYEKALLRERYLQLAPLNDFTVIHTSGIAIEEGFELLKPNIDRLLETQCSSGREGALR